MPQLQAQLAIDAPRLLLDDAPALATQQHMHTPVAVAYACLADLPDPLFIEPGSPWKNGYCESFNSKLRDELLEREIFTTLREAQVLIEAWRRHYNAVRPHSSLGYRPPAPEAILLPAGL